MGGPHTSVGEGSPLPRVRKELPQAARILRFAPFANGEYNDTEQTEVRQVKLVRVVSFLYRLSSFRVILSLPKDLECEAFISCTRVVKGADLYRGLGGIAVSSVGAFCERPRATNGRPYRGLCETVSHQSVGEGLAPAVFDERFFSYIMDRRGRRSLPWLGWNRRFLRRGVLRTPAGDQRSPLPRFVRNHSPHLRRGGACSSRTSVKNCRKRQGFFAGAQNDTRWCEDKK